MTDIAAAKPSTRRRTTTWGNPATLRTPRFIRLFGRILWSANRILVGVTICELIVIVGLALYLTYGTTHSRIYASDGTVFSCEVHFLSRGKS
jgi:hypothetical protein